MIDANEELCKHGLTMRIISVLLILERGLSRQITLGKIKATC